MNEFTAKFGDRILGVFSGFDRPVFRGTLRAIVLGQGMQAYLEQNQVLLKDFARHAQEMSSRLKDASVEAAEKLGRKVKYLASHQISKEKVAGWIAAEQKITEGLVCVLTCVEPCRSFEVYRRKEGDRMGPKA